MSKRSLILYASITGNTEKVALRFKKVFEKKNWECDILKIDDKTDIKQSASLFDCKKYDFICVGSYVHKSLPSKQLIDVMRNNPQSVHSFPGLGQPDGSPRQPVVHKKTILGPENKKGIVFVSYAGHEFGPIEAEPALALLKSEMDHLKFVCIGRFACPGKFGDPSQAWFKDLNDRPHERDLLKAEIFLEEILEELD
jgi:hypothetical protein